MVVIVGFIFIVFAAVRDWEGRWRLGDFMYDGGGGDMATRAARWRGWGAEVSTTALGEPRWLDLCARGVLRASVSGCGLDS